MDHAERQILIAIQNDGRMPNVKLAQLVGLSESPTFRRVKQLEAAGVIRQYVALLEQRKLGLQITAYVSIRMEKHRGRFQQEFSECVANEAHIVECHAVSGAFDFFLKVVARDMDHFSELCMQEIINYPGVTHVESTFSLKSIKFSHALPVTSKI